MRFKTFVISLIIMFVLFAGFLLGFNQYTHGQLMNYILANQSPATPAPKTIIKERNKEPATGNTSEYNKDNQQERNYQDTIKAVSKKDNLTADELHDLMQKNSTFILQVVDNDNDKFVQDMHNINGQKHITIFTISSKELLKCSHKYHVQLLMTNRSVAFFKKGLITSQFEPNSQKKLNKMQSLYTNWLNELLPQLGIQQNKQPQNNQKTNLNNNKQNNNNQQTRK